LADPRSDTCAIDWSSCVLDWHGWVQRRDGCLRLDEAHDPSSRRIPCIRPADPSLRPLRTRRTGATTPPPHARRDRLALRHPSQRDVPAAASRARVHGTPGRRLGCRGCHQRPPNRRAPQPPQASETATARPHPARLLLLAQTPCRGRAPVRRRGTTPPRHRRPAAPTQPRDRHRTVRTDDAPLVRGRPMARTARATRRTPSDIAQKPGARRRQTPSAPPAAPAGLQPTPAVPLRRMVAGRRLTQPRQPSAA